MRDILNTRLKSNIYINTVSVTSPLEIASSSDTASTVSIKGLSGFGSANQIVKVNAAADALEYATQVIPDNLLESDGIFISNIDKTTYNWIQMERTDSNTTGFNIRNINSGLEQNAFIYLRATEYLYIQSPVGDIQYINNNIRFLNWNAREMLKYVDSTGLLTIGGAGDSLQLINNTATLTLPTTTSTLATTANIDTLKTRYDFNTAVSNGKLLIGNSSGNYTVNNLTAGTNIAITNTSGNISIATSSVIPDNIFEEDGVFISNIDKNDFNYFKFERDDSGITSFNLKNVYSGSAQNAYMYLSDNIYLNILSPIGYILFVNDNTRFVNSNTRTMLDYVKATGVLTIGGSGDSLKLVNGSAALTLPSSTGTIALTTDNITGNAATATKIASITNSNIVQLTETQTLSNKTLTLPKINDTSSNHTYNIIPSELTANRNLTIPLITDNDDIVCANVVQTLLNKILKAPVIQNTLNRNLFSNTDPSLGGLDVITIGNTTDTVEIVKANIKDGFGRNVVGQNSVLGNLYGNTTTGTAIFNLYACFNSNNRDLLSYNSTTNLLIIGNTTDTLDVTSNVTNKSAYTLSNTLPTSSSLQPKLRFFADVGSSNSNMNKYNHFIRLDLSYSSVVDCFTNWTYAGSSNAYWGLAHISSSGGVDLLSCDQGGALTTLGAVISAVDTNSVSTFGRAKIGYMGWDDFAGFSHLDSANQTNYALLQYSTGVTYLNTSSVDGMYFAVNNQYKMKLVSSTGNFGINTLTPSEKLEVNGNIKTTGNFTISGTGTLGIGVSSPRTNLDLARNYPNDTSSTSGETSNIYLNVKNETGGTSGIVWFPNFSGYSKTSGFINFVPTGNYFRGELQVGINNIADASSPAVKILTVTSSGLNVVGNIVATGTITPSSDDRIKFGETTIENALETIVKINPVSYRKATELDIPDSPELKTELGVVAQELYNTVPELRHMLLFDKTMKRNFVDENLEGNCVDDIYGYSSISKGSIEVSAELNNVEELYEEVPTIVSLNYNSFHALSIKAIQELLIRVETLESRILELENK